jgi:Protein of unknown function (DUF3396)
VSDEFEPLYNQTASYFTLRLFLANDAPGQLTVELAEKFLSELVLLPCHPTWLWTRRPEEHAKLNTGDFSARRWSAAQKKLLSGEFGALSLFAAHPDAPSHKISCSLNPGTIELTCSLSYLRRLSSRHMEMVLQWGISGWNSSEAAYGYGNLAYIAPRVPFNPADPQQAGYRLPWDHDTPPVHAPHAIPVAWMGSDIDLNLERLYLAGKGIKGAFWANFLSAAYLQMAGGQAALHGFRCEPLARGGLLVVATESPLPEDSEENRQRFLSLRRALQPAFISRAEAAVGTRPLLGHFYREASGA